MTMISDVNSDATDTKQDATPSHIQPSATHGTRKHLEVPTLAISLATALALLALWWGASYARLVSPVFLPSPAAVAASFWSLLTVGFVDSTLFQHIGASLARVLAALFVSVAIGLPVGILIATSRIARGILDPVVEFLRPAPAVGLSATHHHMGRDWRSVKSYGHRPLHAAAHHSVHQRWRARRATGLHQCGTFLRCQQAAGSAWGHRSGQHAVHPHRHTHRAWNRLVDACCAELIAASRGLGFMIQSGAQFLVTDVVIVGIFVIALIAFLLEWLARAAERRFVPWAGNGKK